jgi:hypothetical protein
MPTILTTALHFGFEPFQALGMGRLGNGAVNPSNR